MSDGSVAVERSRRATIRDDSAAAVYALMTELVRQMPRDMSLTSVATLSTLHRLGPKRITDLAGSEGVTQPSMTTLVTSLERAGYVKRRGDPNDKRVALVELTERGGDYVASRRRDGASKVAELIDELTADERRALAAALPALDRLRELEALRRDT